MSNGPIHRLRYRLGRRLLLPWLTAARDHYDETASQFITPAKVHHALSCRDLLRQFIDGSARRRWDR